MSGNDPQGWGTPPSAEGPRSTGNPMNPFSSQGPPPPTGEMPPVQQFRQPQQPPQQYQQPQQYPPQYQPHPEGGSGSAVKLVLIILAVILALALVAAGIFWVLMSRGGTTTAGTAPAQVTVTTVVPPSDPPAAPDAPAPAPDAGGARPANPALPGAAVAANSAARSGAPGGNFNNVYTGSSVTSQPFAAAVRDSFARHYTDTRQTSAVLNVYSPVTGQTYTMNCNDNGEFITCTGGNNAVVYIS